MAMEFVVIRACQRTSVGYVEAALIGVLGLPAQATDAVVGGVAADGVVAIACRIPGVGLRVLRQLRAVGVRCELTVEAVEVPATVVVMPRFGWPCDDAATELLVDVAEAMVLSDAARWAQTVADSGPDDDQQNDALLRQARQMAAVGEGAHDPLFTLLSVLRAAEVEEAGQVGLPVACGQGWPVLRALRLIGLLLDLWGPPAGRSYAGVAEIVGRAEEELLTAIRAVTLPPAWAAAAGSPWVSADPVDAEALAGRLKGDGDLVVLFGARWCRVSRQVEPLLVDTAAPVGVEVVVVDVEDSMEVSSAYGVDAIPAAVVMRDGLEVGRAGGGVGIRRMVDDVERTGRIGG